MGRFHQNAVIVAPILGDDHRAGLCPMPFQLMGERLDTVRESIVVLFDANGDDALYFFQEGHGSRDGARRLTTFLPADHNSTGEATGRLRRHDQQRATASTQQLLSKVRQQSIRPFCATKHYKIVVTRPEHQASNCVPAFLSPIGGHSGGSRWFIGDFDRPPYCRTR
jgi:hypothetical protein